MRTANRSVKVQRILIVLVVAALSCTGSWATIITVSNTVDSGAGSLRAALAGASNGDTIDASGVTGTILLTSGELLVTKSVNIIGPGATNLAVDGNAAGRVIHIGFGPTIIVTISGLTITNGFVGLSSQSQRGGGIFNQSMLVLNACIVSGNSAYFGGGIYNEGRCLYSGGICISDSDGRLTVSNSTFSRNFALNGGGIHNFNGTVNIMSSSFSLNSAAGEGGAVASGTPDGYDAAVTIANSTFAENLAGRAGGIRNMAGSMSISNCTFSGNWSDYDFSGGGGGVHNSGALIVKYCTFNGNSSVINGGAICNEGTAKIGDTVLNAGVSGANLAGAITSLGYNLSSDDGSGRLMATGDLINTNPKLGPLQDNGGPTLTHALLLGSPAIDAGNPSFTSSPNFDQRGSGFPRVVNGRIDIGTFELTPNLLVTAIDRIGSDLRLTFGVALLGENYEVQSRTNLNFGSWESLPGSIPGNGSTAQITVTNAFSVSPQFFRIRQLPEL